MIIASYQDFKQRLVDGYIWLFLLILVLPVILIRLILYWDRWDILTFMIISIGIGLIFAFIMLYFGLWGEADILAFICISLLSPIALSLTNGLPNIYDKNYLELIVPLNLSMIVNAAVIQIPIPIVIASKNYFRYKKNPEAYILPEASKRQKFFASFLGEPLLLSSILTKPVFYYQVMEKNVYFTNDVNLNNIYPVPFIRLTSEPLLRWKMFRAKTIELLTENKLDYKKQIIQDMINSDPLEKWNFDFTIGLKSEEEDLYRQRILLEQATKGKLKRKYLWVQYSIPFLIPMLLGYILAFSGINLFVEFLTLV